MANHKSAEKRIRSNETKNERNRYQAKTMRNALKDIRATKDKKQATEFSFLLAVPTMMAAGGYDLIKSDLAFTSEQLTMLAIGFGVAFVSAWIAVKLFLKYVSNHGFTAFGWYRIALGLSMLAWLFLQKA